ncbi:MAG: hypothetical protein VYE73_08035 [Acidobacteriota bacterium]|nr:hypothetical protein [Acidobacteriota bacterium]
MSEVTTSRLSELVRLASAVGIYKLALVLLAFTAPLLLPGAFNGEAWLGHFHWPESGSPTPTSSLETWHAQHYLYLAAEGYGQPRPPIAYFPLFPWLIRWISLAPGISFLGAALLVSNLSSLAAVILLFALLRRAHPGTEWATLVLLLAFPGALFFQLPYTEGLFLLLIVAAFWGFELERYELVAAAGFLAALTRPVGVALCLVIACDLYDRWRWDRRLDGIEVVSMAAPLAGFTFYLINMRIVSGDALAGLARLPGLVDPGGLVRIPQFFARLFDMRAIHDFEYSLLDRLAFLLVLATLFPVWRLDRRFFWFCLPIVLIAPLAGSFTSFTRYAAVLFPIFVVLGGIFTAGERRIWLATTASIFLAIQVVLLVRHATFHWAG